MKTKMIPFGQRQLLLGRVSNPAPPGVTFFKSKTFPFLAAFLFLLAAITGYAATLTTDRLDYAPFSDVYIDGAGFAAGEVVQVKLDELQADGSYLNVAGWAVTADAAGAFELVWYIFDDSFIGSTLRVTASGPVSGTVTHSFTDSAGAYSINFAAADPAKYIPAIPFPENVTPIVGRGNGDSQIPKAWFNSPATHADVKVESLAPQTMALHQVIPFEVKVTVNGTTTPENGAITFKAGWNIDTSNNSDFGYDETLGVIAAFVDTGDGAHVDPAGNATVQSFSWAVVGDEIQGTFNLAGLESGDTVVVEVWLVLEDTIPPKNQVGGNVQSRLISAATLSNPAATISTGNQTIPLLRVDEFFTANADVSVTKKASSPCSDANISYTIDVKNNSSDTVANTVVATDTLGAGQAFFSASGASYTQNGNVITFQVGSLAPGQTTVLTVTTTPTTTGPVNNQVAVTAITADSNTENNSASATSTVGALPDCTITELVVPLPGFTGKFSGPSGMDGYSWSYQINSGVKTAAGSSQTQEIPIPLDIVKLEVFLTTTKNGCTSSACSLEYNSFNIAGCIVPPIAPSCPGASQVFSLGVSVPAGSVITWTIDPGTSGAAGVPSLDGLSVEVSGTSCGSFKVSVKVDPPVGEDLNCNVDGSFVDDELPSIACGENTTLSGCSLSVLTLPFNTAGQAITASQLAAAGVTASDNCGISAISYKDELLKASCPITIKRKFTVSDACGNSRSCEKTITIEDKTAPVPPSDPATITVDCLSDVPQADALIAKDACSGDVAGVPGDSQPVKSGCGYTITRTWTFQDDCGNKSYAHQTINVKDTIKPEIAGDDVNMTCEDCVIDENTGRDFITAKDNCSGTDVTIKIYRDEWVTAPDACPRILKRTWSAQDACGNTSYFVQKISCIPPVEVVVTSSSLCTYDFDPTRDGRQFRLIFTQDPQNFPCYKLTASNPGQTYFNRYYVGDPGPVEFTIRLPYPYVTQGANPIHAYSNVDVAPNTDGTYCLIPAGPGLPVEIVSGGPLVTLNDYIPAQHGTFHDVVVRVNVPADTRAVYLNMHLDYGLKGTRGYGNSGLNAVICNTSIIAIENYHPYQFFAFENGNESDALSDTIENLNVFKKNPGVGGLSTTQAGESAAGATLQLKNAKGGVLATATADEDGWYILNYKHTGKAADFTVSITKPGFAPQVKTITLKANAYVQADFVLAPNP